MNKKYTRHKDEALTYIALLSLTLSLIISTIELNYYLSAGLTVGLLSISFGIRYPLIRFTYIAITVLFIPIVYVVKDVTNQEPIVNYTIFSDTAYEYGIDGRTLYIDFEHESTLKTFTTREYDFNFVYMSLNDCRPVLKETNIEYWLGRSQIEKSIVCFKDINETTTKGL